MLKKKSYLKNHTSLNRTVQFSVNRSGKDKDWDFQKLTTDFENVTGRVGDILEAVQFGWAINGAWFNGRRCKANVTGVQILLVDIDNTTYLTDEAGQTVFDDDGKRIPIYSEELTIFDALNHPFVKQYCSFIYTTASHKSDWHKLRLVFVLPEVIGRETYEALASIVLENFPHDPACKDAGRVFFGNSNAEIILYNPEAVLDSSFIESAKVKREQDARAHVERERQLQARREENRRRWSQSGRTEKDLEELVRDALSYIPPRQKGSGNYHDCLKILTALKNEFGDTWAISIAEEWSPPSTKDNWFPARKISGLCNSNISIGTIFHLAKLQGWEFPSLSRRVRHKLQKRISKEEYIERFTFPKVIKAFGNKIKSLKKRFDVYGFSKEQLEKQAEIKCIPKSYKKPSRLDVWAKSHQKYT